MKERMPIKHLNGVFPPKQEELEELELDRSRRGSTALCGETLVNLSNSGNMARLWLRKK